MNIIFCINDYYKDVVKKVIFSILLNNKNSKINFFILYSSLNLTQNYVDSFNSFNIFKNYKGINFINVITSNFKFSSRIDYISIETFFRFYIADCLPFIDKCLYLDTDLITNGNIEEFYNTNLEDKYIAGVKDEYIYKENYEILKHCDTYFNAGVLLLNLKELRKDKIKERFEFEAQNNLSKYEYQDQDIINIVCKDKKVEVDSIFNCCSINFDNKKYNLNKANIIHFNGKRKPWNYKNYNKKVLKIWNIYNFLFNLFEKKKIILLNIIFIFHKFKRFLGIK